MIVLPLGLGTRLRKMPWFTVALAAAWAGVYLIDDSATKISAGINEGVERSKLRESSRTLFRQYCREEGGSAYSCRRYSRLVLPAAPTAQATWLWPAPQAYRTTGGQAVTALRDELRSCRDSRQCYLYKDIVWSFLHTYLDEPNRFSELPDYQAFRSSLAQYRNSVSALCREYACLVGGDASPTALFASQFRHEGALHFLGNLLTLLIFGIYVEQRTSGLAYFAGLMAGGTAGLALHSLVFSTPGTITVGASASVSAVLGMFFAFFFSNRMRFFVWLPLGFRSWRLFFAPVKYCFPLLFVISDVIGSLDSGFTEVTVDRVAHGAHLGGFLFGSIVAWLIARIVPVPTPFLYEDELADMDSLRSSERIPDVLNNAEHILAYNPQNVVAMEYTAGVLLRFSHVADEQENPLIVARARRFLHGYLEAICATSVRWERKRQACRVLSQVPMFLRYSDYLGNVGQRTALILGDFALSEGHPVLAIRMYDYYVSRFPAAKTAGEVKKTVGEILVRFSDPQRMRPIFEEFLRWHPGSGFAPVIANWLSQTREASC